MRQVILILYSLAFWVFFTLSSIFLLFPSLVIWIITRWFDRKLYILHQYSCFWASWYVWFNPLWRVRISGRKKINRKKAYVIVSNHQSLVDIIVLYGLFRHFKWVSKTENFRLPVIGWHMSLNKYIRIERGSMESHKAMMESAREMIAEGNSIMIFPQGTRYGEGFMGKFRDGAFKIALNNQADILPVVLKGTSRALPKKGFIFTGFTRIRVKVLDPVPYSSAKDMTVAELRETIRILMEKGYRE